MEEEAHKFASRSDERELCDALSELCADDSDEEEPVTPLAAPPIVISEADFREKGESVSPSHLCWDCMKEA